MHVEGRRDHPPESLAPRARSLGFAEKWRLMPSAPFMPPATRALQAREKCEKRPFPNILGAWRGIATWGEKWTRGALKVGRSGISPELRSALEPKVWSISAQDCYSVWCGGRVRRFLGGLHRPAHFGTNSINMLGGQHWDDNAHHPKLSLSLGAHTLRRRLARFILIVGDIDPI